MEQLVARLPHKQKAAGSSPAPATTQKAMPPRPKPPAEVYEPLPIFMPAPDLEAWIRQTFLDEAGALFNPEHAHLRDAVLGVIWTNYPNSRQGRTVLGMAEIPVFRCGAWQKGRQEQQLIEWFGDVPDFLITLDATYCAEASDAEFCALVEHELCHCAQAKDEYGVPKFRKDSGLPVFAMRGHDVEEFVSVVRRYGPTSDALRDMVRVANAGPEMPRLNIQRACGTCLLKSA